MTLNHYKPQRFSPLNHIEIGNYILDKTIFFLLTTVWFNPDLRGRSVGYIGKVGPSSDKRASRESNKCSHPSGYCSPHNN